MSKHTTNPQRLMQRGHLAQLRDELAQANARARGAWNAVLVQGSPMGTATHADLDADALATLTADYVAAVRTCRELQAAITRTEEELA